MENELDSVCQSCGVTFVSRAPRDPQTDAPVYCSLCRAHARTQKQHKTPNYTGDTNEYRSPMQGTFPEPRPRRARYRRDPANDTDKSLQNDSASARPHRHRSRHGGANSTMFTAVCSKCGATAHVPFQPSKFQRILCRGCYREQQSAQGTTNTQRTDNAN